MDLSSSRIIMIGGVILVVILLFLLRNKKNTWDLKELDTEPDGLAQFIHRTIRSLITWILIFISFRNCFLNCWEEALIESIATPIVYSDNTNFCWYALLIYMITSVGTYIFYARRYNQRFQKQHNVSLTSMLIKSTKKFSRSEKIERIVGLCFSLILLVVLLNTTFNYVLNFDTTASDLLGNEAIVEVGFQEAKNLVINGVSLVSNGALKANLETAEIRLLWITLGLNIFLYASLVSAFSYFIANIIVCILPIHYSMGQLGGKGYMATGMIPLLYIIGFAIFKNFTLSYLANRLLESGMVTDAVEYIDNHVKLDPILTKENICLIIVAVGGYIILNVLAKYFKKHESDESKTVPSKSTET